jgi:uncharacterized protein (TIGR03000 family)
MGGCSTGGVAAGPVAGCATCQATTAPAKIVVTLPKKARLTIDGAKTVSISGKRTFRTPSLKAGKKYHYVLKAKFKKNGKVVTVKRRVAVRAGKTTRIRLAAPAQAVAFAK